VGEGALDGGFQLGLGGIALFLLLFPFSRQSQGLLRQSISPLFLHTRALELRTT
jgi:hypothetical protein